jgi:hypothetical protein
VISPKSQPLTVVLCAGGLIRDSGALQRRRDGRCGRVNLDAKKGLMNGEHTGERAQNSLHLAFSRDLESRYPSSADRGFKSLPLRFLLNDAWLGSVGRSDAAMVPLLCCRRGGPH